MFALVDKSDNSITKMLNGNKGIQIGDLKYPRAIYTLWTEAERNAINIYEITIDNSKFKDQEWYINTNVTYAFDGTNATGSYGDATAKAHADSTFTAEDEEDGLGTEGELKSEGLKTVLIRNVKLKAAKELSKTDWYITRKTEKNTAIPSAITTHRNAVRSKQAAMETAITNASDTPALETLYTYTTDSDGVQSRPLGEIPTLE
jgi:hypothetical protein